MKRASLLLSILAMICFESNAQLLEQFVEWDSDFSCRIVGVENIEDSNDFLIYADLVEDAGLGVNYDRHFTAWGVRRTNIDIDEVWTSQIPQYNNGLGGIQDLTISQDEVYIMNTITEWILCPSPDSSGDFEPWFQQSLLVRIVELFSGNTILETQSELESCNGLPFNFQFIDGASNGKVYAHDNSQMYVFDSGEIVSQIEFDYSHSFANPIKSNDNYFSFEDDKGVYLDYDYNQKNEWSRTEFEILHNVGRGFPNDLGMFLCNNPLDSESQYWAYTLRSLISEEYEVVLESILDKMIFGEMEDWFYENAFMFSNDGGYFLILEPKFENNERFFRLYQVTLETGDLQTVDFGFSEPREEGFDRKGVTPLGIKELDDGMFVIYGIESYQSQSQHDSLPDRGYLAFGKIGAIEWPLSIQDQQETVISIGPNPSYGQLNIHIDPDLVFCSDSNGLEFRLFDINGKVLQTESLTLAKNKIYTSVPTTGTYLWSSHCADNYVGGGKLLISSK